MTPSQRAMRQVADELETIEKRSAELIAQEELNEEGEAEIRTLAEKKKQLLEKRSALRVLLEEDEKASVVHDDLDAEQRERIELRSRAKLTNYFVAAAAGREVQGAELELRQAAGVSGIPLEIFEVPEQRQIETRADAATTSPATVGINLDPIRPMIYARAVVPRMGVAMPRVESGTFASATIATGLSAGATAAGAARESTAAQFSVSTTTPHRVSARLSIRLEDISAIGVGNFESALRQNLMLALSDELDKLGLNGDGQNANPQGLLPQLTDPTDPTEIVNWEGFVKVLANAIDGGPWAEGLGAVRLLVNAETMRKAETTFQKGTGNNAANFTPGEMSAAAYLREKSGGFFSSRRMPATASNIARAVRYRSGTMGGLDGVNAVRTAVCPVWAEVGIDDIYSDSASAIRHFTLHHLIGDVIIIQTDAYERVDLKVS